MDNLARTIDLRADPRVPLIISGNLTMHATGAVMTCTIIDLSAGGAGMQFKGLPPCSDMLGRLSIQDFGDFEGITTRSRRSGFRFVRGEAERERLEAKLVAYVEHGISDPDHLSSLKSVAGKTQLSYARSNGDREQCDVLKISLRGVSLGAQCRPPPGEVVRLGRMYGRISAHRRDGIEVQFVSFVPLT